MEEKMILDMLTPDSVSVKRQQYTTIEGKQYDIGQPHRKSYINNLRGRQDIDAELPEAYCNAVFAIWGDTPSMNMGGEEYGL